MNEFNIILWVFGIAALVVVLLIFVPAFLSIGKMEGDFNE